MAEVGRIVIRIRRDNFTTENPERLPVELKISVDGGAKPKDGFVRAVEALVEQYVSVPIK